MAAAERLLVTGQAYKCFCSKEELEAKREAAMAAKGFVGYDRTCRNLSPEEITEKEANGIPADKSNLVLIHLNPSLD